MSMEGRGLRPVPHPPQPPEVTVADSLTHLASLPGFGSLPGCPCRHWAPTPGASQWECLCAGPAARPAPAVSAWVPERPKGGPGACVGSEKTLGSLMWSSGCTAKRSSGRQGAG